MKRLNRSVAIALCLNLISLCNAKAQQTQEYVKKDSTKKHLGLLAKVDILWPILSSHGPNIAPVYSASIEKFIGQRISMQVSGFYSFLNNSIPVNTMQTMKMYMIAPEAKYFFSKSAKHQGLYAGVSLNYMHEVDNTHTAPTAAIPYDTYGNNLFKIVTVGAIAGLQYYLTKRIETDVLIGLGYGYDYFSFSAVQGEAPGNTVRYSDYVQPIANINVGYLF